MREIDETTAVVDRIEDGAHAVLIVGDPPERELAVPVAALPAGAREGHWLNVRLDGERLVHAEIDHEATDRARERVRAKMEQLRRRGRRLDGC